MGLSKGATLEEFSKLRGKEITLNFLAVDKGLGRVEILNHHTSPNMPVWAAIIATTSTPKFFKPLNELKDWNFTFRSLA